MRGRSRLVRPLGRRRSSKAAAALAFARVTGAELAIAVWAGAFDAAASAGLGGIERHRGDGPSYTNH